MVQFILDLAWAEELKVIFHAPISFIIMMIVGWGIIVQLVGLYYRRQLSNKDSNIELLRDKLSIVDEGTRARIEVDKDETAAEKDPYEKEALAIRNGNPIVHQTFLSITSVGYLDMAWSPHEEPWKWEGVHNPSRYDLREKEATRYLWNKGYFSGFMDGGTGDYRFTVSDFAERVRQAYDHQSQTP